MTTVKGPVEGSGSAAARTGVGPLHEIEGSMFGTISRRERYCNRTAHACLFVRWVDEATRTPCGQPSVSEAMILSIPPVSQL